MKAKIYIKKYTPKKEFDWGGAYKIPYISYDITETDYRTKTAKFDSNYKINLGKGSYAVKIAHPCFETFTGIILDVEDKKDGKYSYQCQDWNRIYMSKPIITMKANVYLLVKMLLSYATDSKWGLKGLLSIKKYNQRKYGSTFEFNPFKNIKNVDIKDKTVREAIEELVYSQHPFIDIHYSTTGIMKFSPYYLKEWRHPSVEIPLSQTTDFNYKLDTTNLITMFMVKGKPITFNKLFNSKKNVLKGFTTLKETMPTGNTSNAKTSNTNKASTKQGNPYGTKKKEVWANMDSCWGSSTDHKYLKTFCDELRKLGWKVHNTGVGPSTHYNIQGKNGIWLTMYGGVDTGCLREAALNTSFHNNLLSRNMRTVIGFMGGASDIRKGGRGYKRVSKAWDDNYSSGDTSLNYPAAFLADNGIPFFYSLGNHPKKAAILFNNGGESQIALEKKFRRTNRGYYASYNWGSQY